MSVNLFGVMIGRPSVSVLDDVLDRAAGAQVTYDHVGSTLDGGGRRAHLDIGRGPAAFTRAAEGLRAWVPHRGIGARIHPASAPIAEGADVVVVLSLGPFTVLAPDRIVKVIDEPRHLAFAYGTLPGHPERGEESFDLELLPGGTVRFTIGVDAVPATVAARLAAPGVLLVQRLALRRYLTALARHVAGAPSPSP